jgi:2,3-bisphosphoglycerate-dependent phosphoglycerate mutase
VSAADPALLAGPFCFLRHGETENNRLGLVAGATDVPLNATGLAQARESARRLADSAVDAIWSSPMQRARTTAHCIAETLALPVFIVPQLAERNWGEFEGKPRALRVSRVTPVGGESAEVFSARTIEGLQQIRASGLPLIVAHSGTFRVLSEWLQIPARSEAVVNCMPLRFAPHAGGWCVTQL